MQLIEEKKKDITSNIKIKKEDEIEIIKSSGIQ